MEYQSTIAWKRDGADFSAKTFDRTHTVSYGSGTSFSASSAPEFLGNPALPNPEELFTASIASCFALTFIYWAAVKGVTLDSYDCVAVGKLGKNADGKMAMVEVVLKPSLRFADGEPDAALVQELLTKAHDNCFISCSVKTPIKIEY